MSLFTNSENIICTNARRAPLHTNELQQPFSTVESNNRMFPAASNPISRKLYDLFGSRITAQKNREFSQTLSEIFTKLSDVNSSIDMLAAQVRVIDTLAPFKHATTKVANILAWQLSKEATLNDQNSPFLQRGLLLLFMQNSLESGWHKDLLPTDQPQACKDRLVQAIVALDNEQSAKVMRIYKLLFSIPTIDCDLTESEMITLSIFTTAAKMPSGYLKKDFFSIPRTIHCNAETHDFYLLSKNKERVPGGLIVGSAKKVTFGYMLPSSNDRDMEPIAELTNLYESENSVILLGEEANLQRQFHKQANSQGIWPIWSVCTHSKTPSNPKISIIMPAGDGTLCHMLATHQRIPILGICRQLCHGLHVVHQSGYLHGDLKLENILYSMLETHCKVGYTDFGFCFKTAEARLPQIFEKGFYGSVVVSPPEFFGQKNFTSDFFKVEMWAFGCILHNLIFGKDPLWIPQVTEKYYALCVAALRNPESEEVAVPLEDRIHFKKLIAEQIEEPRKKIVENKQMDPIEKELKLLVYDCLRLDPNDRLDSTTALMRILALS